MALPRDKHIRSDQALNKCCHELVALHPLALSSFGDGWPVAPGEVLSTTCGRASVLHFAAGRWLVPDLTPALSARCEVYVATGTAVLVDVEGKWRKLTLSGVAATQIIASGTAVELILDRRECAALTLFDCPVILARTREVFELWVQSSYSSSLTAAITARACNGLAAGSSEIRFDAETGPVVPH